MLFQGLVGLSEAMYLWLVAAGLSLIFGVMRVLNFAHGSLYMLGAYFAWVAFRISGSFWVALLVGPVLVAAAGWVIEFVFLRRVYAAPEAFQLLLTFAFVLMLDDIVKLAFGPVYQSPPTPAALSGAVMIGHSILPTYHLFILGVGGLVGLGLWLFLEKTSFGLIIRATAADREMARALGVRSSRLFTWVFVLGAWLAGLGRRPLDADARHLARHGRVHHHRGVRGGGAGRARLLARRLPRIGAHRPAPRLRAALHARVRAGPGLHGHGGGPHRPPLGPLRGPRGLMRARTIAGAVLALIVLLVPVFAGPFLRYLVLNMLLLALLSLSFIPLFFLVVNVGQAGKIFPAASTEFLKGQGYGAFQLPSSLLLAASFGTAALFLVEDIEGGYFDKLRAAPVSRTALVLGRLVAESVKSLLIAAAIVLLGAVVRHHDRQRPARLPAAARADRAVGAWSSSGFMQLIALKTRSAAATNSGGLIFFPLLFLTPNFVPRDLLTRPMEIAATFNPVTYIMEALRSLILEDFDWATILPGFAVVFVLGLDHDSS